MDKASSSSSSYHTSDLPKWPLRSDGSLDARYMIPHTIAPLYKYHGVLSRNELVKMNILPQRTIQTNKPIKQRLLPKPTASSQSNMTNLELLELYELSGEDIDEFRSSLLESLGERRRATFKEEQLLMHDHELIRNRMNDLRKIGNEIRDKLSRQDSIAFFSRRADLSSLGYFPPPLFLMKHSAAVTTGYIDPPEEEFPEGYNGASRVSYYNWRNKNERLDPFDMNDNSVIDNGDKNNDDTLPYNDINITNDDDDGMDRNSSMDIDMPQLQKEKEKGDEPIIDMDNSPLRNDIVKNRSEVNLTHVRKANKVDPSLFPLPRGFIKYGDKMMHESRAKKMLSITKLCDKEMMNRKRKTIVVSEMIEKKIQKRNEEEKEKNDIKSNKEDISSDEKEDKSFKKELNKSKTNDDEIIAMDDIDEEDNIESNDNHNSPPKLVNKGCQTIPKDDRNEKVIATQLDRLQSVHEDDMEKIRELKEENINTFKSLTKFHAKFIQLTNERNYLKSCINTRDRESRIEKIELRNARNEVKELRESNCRLLTEMKLLRREIAMYDRNDPSHSSSNINQSQSSIPTIINQQHLQ